MELDPGNLQELFSNAWLVVTALVAGVVFAARCYFRLNAHEERIIAIEEDTKTQFNELRKDIASLRIEMIRGFATQGIEIATKQDIDQ